MCASCRLEEETALRNLLVVLAKDKDAWQSWLAFCNDCTCALPQIQGALGRALARSDESALVAYVDSISLKSRRSDGGMRDCVTYCLTTFRARAGAGRRRALWRRAFDRWRDWDFGAKEIKGLNAVARSVSGLRGRWMGRGRRAARVPHRFQSDRRRRRIRTLDRRWHPSLSAAISSFFRLISRYEVFAHACNRSAIRRIHFRASCSRTSAAARTTFVQRQSLPVKRL